VDEPCSGQILQNFSSAAGKIKTGEQEHAADAAKCAESVLTADVAKLVEDDRLITPAVQATHKPVEGMDRTVRRGVIVRLHNLGSAPHLNGMLGLCLYRGNEDRWVVNLDSEEPGQFRNVREQNLEFVCHGGAVQPEVLQPKLKAGGSEVQNVSDGPLTAGKRKRDSEGSEVSLAESLAELEREQCNAEDQGPSKRATVEVSPEFSVKEGMEGLVEDILERPQDAIMSRLLVASTDDLAKILSPETTAYVVLARSYRTSSSGG